MQESKSYASFSTNFITSTNSDDCSELTHEQCLTRRTEDHYLLYPLVIGPARFGDFYKKLFLLCRMNTFAITINYREIDTIF